MHKILAIKVPLAFDILGSIIRGSKLCDVIRSKNSVHNSSLFIGSDYVPGQITVILCVRRAATSQPGRIAANLFVRRPEKQVAVIVLLTVTNRFRLLPSRWCRPDQR